ncbi:MAG TPA: hypothetical protein DCS93_44020 [Microscillaceae bacterium]|nr:hypothetical protein [Microscillaceae bacterium]
MDQTAFNQIVTYYVQQRLKGMDFGQIRAELTEKKVTHDTINRLIKAIDNEELYKVERKSNQQKGIEYILFGLLLIFIPLSILLYDYVSDNGPLENLHIIIYPSFILGIPMFTFGVNKYRQKPDRYKSNYPMNDKTSRDQDIEFVNSHNWWFK